LTVPVNFNSQINW